MDQEIRRRNDRVASANAFGDDDLVSNLQPGLHLTWLKLSISVAHKDQLPCAGVKKRRCGNDQLPAKKALETHIDVHPRFQLEAWVREDHTHSSGASVHVDLRQNLVDSSAKRLARIRIDSDFGWISGLNLAQVGLEYLCVDPDAGKIGDGIEMRLGLDVHIRQDVFLGDVSGDG